MRKNRIMTILVVTAIIVGLMVISGCSKSNSPKPLEKKENTTKKIEETKPEDYPNLEEYEDLSVDVSVKKQEMYVKSGDKIIFMTPVSTGKPETPTPEGDYVIEPERGDFFYNANSGEGAYYWVSFKDHGIYLFHSLATDEQGNEIEWEAKLLGQPASHGCIRMKRDAAKWFYENIPVGVPVHIE